MTEECFQSSQQTTSLFRVWDICDKCCMVYEGIQCPRCSENFTLGLDEALEELEKSVRLAQRKL